MGMKLIRGGAPVWKYDEWITLTGCNGVGTATVLGTNHAIRPTIDNENDIIIGFQVEYSIRTTAGAGFGIGSINATNFRTINDDVTSASPTTGGTTQYLAHSRRIPSTAFLRRWTYFVRVDTWYNNADSLDRYQMRTAGKGTGVTTEWIIESARVRVIYVTP